VVHVEGADTLDVRLEDGRTERLRLLGVAAPKTVEPLTPAPCFEPEAAARASELALERPALLELATEPLLGEEIERRDRWGSLLGYLWVDHQLLNLRLVAEGFALPSPASEDARYATELDVAGEAARQHGLGLWSACAAPWPAPTARPLGRVEPVVSRECPSTHPIKGARTADGEPVYHRPGARTYVRARPEACFAGEDDARAAGYTRSRR